MKTLLAQILVGFAACAALGQGTLVYDQQSATNDTGGSGITATIQSNQPLGQSFVPTFSNIGFIRLFLGDPTPSGIGATAFINLWSGSISNGTLVASTDPVFIRDGFASYTNFFFSNPATITPNATYYFQPILLSGDSALDVGVTAGTAYVSGTEIFKGTDQAGFDLWFREGTVVPEPAMISLVLLGAAGIYFQRRKGNL